MEAIPLLEANRCIWTDDVNPCVSARLITLKNIQLFLQSPYTQQIPLNIPSTLDLHWVLQSVVGR